MTSSQMSYVSWNPAYMPDRGEVSPKAPYTSSPPQLSSPQLPPPSPPQSENDQHGNFIPNYPTSQSSDANEEIEDRKSQPKDLESIELKISQGSSISAISPADDVNSHDCKKETLKCEPKRPQIDSESSPNKHKSTMSFTRTVSEEVTWIDEEVDFDWGYTRKDTDVLIPMMKSDRTNSFPQTQAYCYPENDSLHSLLEENNNQIEQTPSNKYTENGHNITNDFSSKPSVTAGQKHYDVQEIFPTYDSVGTEIMSETIQPAENSNEGSDYRDEEFLSLSKFESHSSDKTISTNKHINKLKESNRINELNNVYHNQTQTQVLDRDPEIQSIESSCYEHKAMTQNIVHESDKQTSQNLQEIQDRDMNIDLSLATYSMSENSNTLPQNRSEALKVNKINSNDNDLVARWREALSGDSAGENLLEDDDLLPDDDEQTGKVVHRNEIDPAVLFGSDDEGFLEDLDQNAVTIADKGNIVLNSQSSPCSIFHEISHLDKEVCPDRFSKPSIISNQFMQETMKTSNLTPGENSLSDSQSYNTPKYSETSGLPPSTSIRPAVNYSAVETQGTDLPKAKSFASMSKGGYSSPYDLPMDLVPRKRSSLHLITRVASSQLTTPPRLNSQGGKLTNSSTDLTTRNASQPLPCAQTQSTRALRNSKSDFFEELPISSKSRPTSRRSSTLPTVNQGHQSNDNSISSAAMIVLERHSSSPSETSHSKLNQGFVAPNRVSPYAPLSSATPPNTHPSTHNSIQVSHNQPQSPYPPASHAGIKQNVSPYSASPPSSTNLRSYHPRTSSPLANFKNNQNAVSTSDQSLGANSDPPKRSAGHEYNLHLLSPTREVDESGTYSSVQEDAAQQSTFENQSILSSNTSPLPPHTSHNRNPSSNINSFFTNSPQQYQDSCSAKFSPLQRPRTQSPESMLIGSRNRTVKNEQYQRSASVESAFITQPRCIASFPSMNILKESNQEVNYITPSDGRELDPLQRWKGSPIFAWGVGGTIITSFPKSVPRYEVNQAFPAIHRYPGEIKLKFMKEINSLNPLLARFPGPLKAKSKKKDVIAWLTSGIDLLESDTVYPSSTPVSHNEKCIVERILLWKILRIFIEHDGTLEGTPNVENTVRGVLSFGENTSDKPLYAAGVQLPETPQTIASKIQSDSVDPAAIYKIKEFLMQGQREKAVWESVDKRLWAHAILISNTVSQDLYKQVAQEFIQKELRIIGEKTQSLAALYEIFAGNFEESIDELVPPSARAGFQMVSTLNDRGSSSNASNGLDKWRETLNLILSNRNVEDTRALTALGKLLSSYGRAEAAHICFLFARSHAVFGGIDDPLSSYVLVGSDQLKQAHAFGIELESILLSEVFEYGMSLSSNTATAVPIPHLAAYKLYFAKILAQYGFCEKALRYCETIVAAITSQTRRSPYYHSQLVFEVEDLSQRLKQSPKDESASWISKPSIDKAKGSVWATFNKFVAGDESDGGDNASSAGTVPDIGPFSKITGGTPTITHPSSVTEFPGLSSSCPIPNNTINSVSTIASSRYAPISAHTAVIQDSFLVNPHASQTRRSTSSRSLTDQTRYQPQRSMPSTTDMHHSRTQIKQAVSTNAFQKNSYPSLQLTNIPDPISISANEIPPVNHRPLDSEYSSIDSPTSQSSKVMGNLYSTSFTSQQSNQIHSMSTETSSATYESPISNSYDPPKGDYEPCLTSKNEESDSSSDSIAKQKTSANYEINDTSTKISTPIEKTRAEKDRETDEAFRRAAEADAQRDKKTAPAKSGWSLISWLGVGTKNQDTNSMPNKPIRAKLGEASSFVYDPELKRWVNKNAGTELAESKSSTPPPPRAAGPLRSGNATPVAFKSSTGQLTNLEAKPLLTNRASSERILQSSSLENSNNNIGGNDGSGSSVPHGLPRTTSSSSFLPPSRPGTSMSNASSIDDLLGPPSLTRRSGNKTKKKGRGYVDVMSDVTS